MPEKPLLSLLAEKLKGPNRRVWIALVCYAILIATALYVLLPVRSQEERYLLGFVLCVFAILIFKTLRHARDGKMD